MQQDDVKGKLRAPMINKIPSDVISEKIGGFLTLREFVNIKVLSKHFLSMFIDKREEKVIPAVFFYNGFLIGRFGVVKYNKLRKIHTCDGLQLLKTAWSKQKKLRISICEDGGKLIDWGTDAFCWEINIFVEQSYSIDYFNEMLVYVEIHYAYFGDLHFLHPKLECNKEVMKVLIKETIFMYLLLSKRLKLDKSFTLELLELYPSCYRCIYYPMTTKYHEVVTAIETIKKNNNNLNDKTFDNFWRIKNNAGWNGDQCNRLKAWKKKKRNEIKEMIKLKGSIILKIKEINKLCELIYFISECVMSLINRGIYSFPIIVNIGSHMECKIKIELEKLGEAYYNK